MLSSLARASIRSTKQQVRNFATPRRTPPPRADALKRGWLNDPGTYPVIVVISFGLVLVAYKMKHDIMSPEAHFNRTERLSLDYINNERSTQECEKWSNHRTLHQTK